MTIFELLEVIYKNKNKNSNDDSIAQSFFSLNIYSYTENFLSYDCKRNVILDDNLKTPAIFVFERNLKKGSYLYIEFSQDKKRVLLRFDNKEELNKEKEELLDSNSLIDYYCCVEV